MKGHFVNECILNSAREYIPSAINIHEINVHETD